MNGTAQLTFHLNTAGAKSITFDLVLAEPDRLSGELLHSLSGESVSNGLFSRSLGAGVQIFDALFHSVQLGAELLAKAVDLFIHDDLLTELFVPLHDFF
jgi:hypothetical protein